MHLFAMSFFFSQYQSSNQRWQMSVEFQFSLFGQTDRLETQTVAASKQIENKTVTS